MQKSAGWLQRGSAVALTMATMIVAGCGGGDGGGGASAGTDTGVIPVANNGNPPGTAPTNPSSASPSNQSGTTPTDPGAPNNPPTVVAPATPVGSSNRSPTIAATPPAEAIVGSAYTLTPTVSDPDGDTLAFSIQNRPSWATFSTVTGQLTGTPGAQHVGTYPDIVITVSDGSSTVALPAFTITVAPAVAQAPTTEDAGVARGAGTTLQWEAPTVTIAGTALSALAGYRIHYGTKPDVLDNTIIVSSPGTMSYSVADLAPGTYYFAVRAVDDRGGESELSNIVQLTVS